jgi:hypothetical protein
MYRPRLLESHILPAKVLKHKMLSVSMISKKRTKFAYFQKINLKKSSLKNSGAMAAAPAASEEVRPCDWTAAAGASVTPASLCRPATAVPARPVATASAAALYRTAAAVAAGPVAAASATAAAGALYRPASGVADRAAGGEVLRLGVRLGLGERVGKGQQTAAQHGGGQDRLYKYSKKVH